MTNSPTATVHHTYPPIREAFKQPRPVWAIAFATTISFMGIGLVDPILPAISKELGASSAQTMLIFTSYLVITALTMFFTAWVSARIGLRKTILLGLTLVVLFAVACAASNSVSQIIGWRAGWGLGNALFLSTALSAIVSAAYGGTAGAIILYEAAIGIGMALGPLLGGVLGHLSWRGPFLGTALLMAGGFLAIALLYRTANSGGSSKSNVMNHKTQIGILAAFRALKIPALGILSASAWFYNMMFFVLLAYSPFPLEAAAARSGMKFGELELGLVFFGWGIALALTSVGIAPILTRRLGLLPTINAGIGLAAILLVVLAVEVNSLLALIVAVVASGIVFGLLNTAFTEAVMDATSLPRNVASSAYSGVRFFGGALASATAGYLAAKFGAPAPYWVGAICALCSLLILFSCRRYLHFFHKRLHLPAESEAQAISAGS